MTVRGVIGFDREIRLEWLDAIASRAASGDSADVARTWLDGYLSDLLGGAGHSGNRGKTVTVLMRIWFSCPPGRAAVREQALRLLPTCESNDRLALHWTMCCSAYPFFGEVAIVVGRLMALQGEVDRQAVLRRLAETWGDRPAVSRGGRAVWTSMTRWGVLKGESARGRYSVRSRIRPSAKVVKLLCQGHGGVQDFLDPQMLRTRTALMMFPFEVGP